MLISHQLKFVFIHIQKTGGDSLSRLLAEKVPDLTTLAAKHERLQKVPALLGEYRDYYKFAFIRNPWDRLVSWYSMIQEAAQLSATDAEASERAKIRYEQVRNNPLWRYVLKESTNFDSFILNCLSPVEVRTGVYYSFAYNQLDYITDTYGGVCVDFIGRFERFFDDVKVVLARFGISIGNNDLNHENTSWHDHYSTYFTPDTQAIVFERYQRDIEHFGYTFESYSDLRFEHSLIHSQHPPSTSKHFIN
jgi:hypothetical protein